MKTAPSHRQTTLTDFFHSVNTHHILESNGVKYYMKKHSNPTDPVGNARERQNLICALNAGFDMHGSYDYVGNTLLMLAVLGRHEDLVEELIQRQVRVDQVNFPNQATALHLAIESGTFRTSRLLVGAGANLNLVVGFKKQTPLHLACRFSLYDVVKLLVDAGADINAQTCDGETPLHYACNWWDFAIVHYLVAMGANVDVRATASDWVSMFSYRRVPIDYTPMQYKRAVAELCTYAGGDSSYFSMLFPFETSDDKYWTDTDTIYISK
jgi:ankyrin repeat protein